jgi:hypothetical protein
VASTSTDDETSAAGRHKPKSGWEKFEILAKAVAWVGVPLVGAVATLFLNSQSERNRDSQFRLNLIQARETADSDIRARMFDFLLTKYFSVQSHPIATVEDFETREMVLRLMIENFQEHFSSKSLFTHLYQQAQTAEAKATGGTKKQWAKVKAELIQVGLNASSTQLIALTPTAFIAGGIQAPLVPQIDPNSNVTPPLVDAVNPRVFLYPRGLADEQLHYHESVPFGFETRVPGDGRGPLYSIRLEVDGILEDAATLAVDIYEDKFKGKTFDPMASPHVSQFKFDASYFSTPYTDNTALPDGTRFAVLYKGCTDLDAKQYICQFPPNPMHRVFALFDVVTFKANLITLRDRPDIDQLIEATPKKSVWHLF